MFCSLFFRGFFEVTAELESHRREEFILVIRFAARTEPLVESGGEYRHRNAFINRCLDRPPAFTGIGDPAGELGKLPNHMAMEGHTDAKPYPPSAMYTNWELSSDRANAARRLMQQSMGADKREHGLKIPAQPNS